jgi:hypothetical protein
MNKSIVLHHHRYGTSTYIVEHKCDTYDLPEDLLIKELEIEFEDNREENIDVIPIPDNEIVTLSC